MIDMTYDPSADAAYIYLGKGKVASTAELSDHIIADYDESGRVIGIEILAATKTLAPGDWTRARLPGTDRADAAE